jgi:Ca-activated chloride channel family protein
MLKNVLTHFIDHLQGNRIQLIAYSEDAYTLVPLTNDYALLKFQLQRLQPASLTGRTSDLSTALLYALQTQQNVAGQTGKPVFVMLTDASRPARHIDPRVAAELVAQQGIRLHTIAIGAGSYAAEDIENVTLIYHPASFQLLEDIARTGQGQFFWAKDASTLRDALQAIQNAEKRQTVATPVYITHPLYYWPLAAALLWLLLHYVLVLVRKGVPV